jgi:hypothetical protein
LFRIADVAGEVGERGDRLGDVGRVGDGVVRGHRADRHRAARHRDAAQVAEAAEVDQLARLGQALLERRDQRHAPGDELGLVVGLDRVGRGVDAGRLLVFEVVHR